MTVFKLACALGFLAASAAAAAPPPELARAVAEVVRIAPDHGLDPAEFALPDGAGAAEARERLIRYASAQHGLRAPANRFPADWSLRPEPYDAAADFGSAWSQGRLQGWVAGLAPADPGYQRLGAAYRRYRALADRGGWPILAATARPGDAGPAVEALAARLAVEDPGAGPAALYDAALEAAVRRAQARHGLEADGVAGRATLAALNVSAQARAEQIALNLERRRWLPRSLPARRVEVNVADASLALYEADKPPLSMRVIVGRPDKRTPMLQDRIRAVVLNPPWNVPASIARTEIWPKIRKDPGYMAREGFVVKPDGSLQQRPGPRCALGAIKFDLANPFGVYLHDTPARTLFAQTGRALSHGCMRVEKPNEMARRLLADDPEWSGDAVDAALLSGQTVRIPLKAPIEVEVVYWTAFVDADGTLQFRPDVYGWDRTLQGLLERSRPARP